MHLVFSIDWRSLLVPTVSLLELALRGSVVYLSLLAALRFFRREAGALSLADLLVVVIVADAAQNAMASQYNSLTEGGVLIATIFAWNAALDWLGYRFPWFHRLLHPAPLPLIAHGRILRQNMRRQMITMADLKEQLREQGIDDVSLVKRCYFEGDGRLSVIKKDPDGDPPPDRKRAGV